MKLEISNDQGDSTTKFGGMCDPVFLVSDMDDMIDLIHRKRTRIEEGFRDLKSLFGFRHLVLKNPRGFSFCGVPVTPN